MESKDLRKAGLKVTLPRVKILEILEGNREEHLSAEDVYRHLMNAGADIGLATVYRVLTQFEAAGIVKRHNFEGNQAVFELDEGSHHDHMVCVECGQIQEFVDETIEERQKAVAREHDFELTDHSLILYGRCAQCREAAQG
ncbi:Ferric uptake regulation protein [wastewater metagenome]|uniref:Ferric uptake regulation protein n=2 Tax=unclassified sequences TaxID=12908 RepID=A0A5B8RF13_9ZZZZ|nr:MULTISPECIES: ferric iron uptake transcriptional regulator [Arhodomonas]MCS4505472.1 ferric iron uptake transcriptional regulator [Arhodomonas aquaeolei]QEA06122.1 ferric uptake regulation protein [uncultured organism]